MSGSGGRWSERAEPGSASGAPARPIDPEIPYDRGSVDLSASDLADVEETIRVLLSPLAYPTVDDWRSAVNGAVGRLLGADAVGFLLPAEGLEEVYSEELDVELLRTYSKYDEGLLKGAGLWRDQLAQKVWTRRSVTRRAIPELEATDYWRELIVPLRAYDSLGATVPLEGSERPATLYLHHECPNGRKFGPRERMLLRLLHPALAAGVTTWRRVAAWSDRLVALVDALPAPTQLHEAGGGELYRNRALRDLLAAEPERHRLEAALRRMAAEIGRLAGGEVSGPPPESPLPATRSVGTSSGHYDLAAALVRPETLGGRGAARDVLLTVQGPGLQLPELDEIRTRTPLTPREAEVALLLVRRQTNEEIASALVISPHTARRHTERVLRKLGIRSRRDVRGAIREAVEQERGRADPPD